MKKNFFLMASLILTVALCMVSCKKENINANKQETAETAEPSGDGIIQNAVKDYDGNTYNAIKLSNQVWMASNLRTTHFANGEEIEEGTVSNYHRPYYHKTDGNIETYGYLYNWKAALNMAESSENNPSGIQGVCPNGWHLPSEAEWEQLINYCKSKSEYTCTGSKSCPYK